LYGRASETTAGRTPVRPGWRLVPAAAGRHNSPARPCPGASPMIPSLLLAATFAADPKPAATAKADEKAHTLIFLDGKTRDRKKKRSSFFIENHSYFSVKKNSYSSAKNIHIFRSKISLSMISHSERA
jgi:hypothetical protein